MKNVIYLDDNGYKVNVNEISMNQTCTFKIIPLSTDFTI